MKKLLLFNTIGLLFSFDAYAASAYQIAQNLDTAPKMRISHAPLLHSAAFSPDGTKIVTISYRTLKIWDVQTAQELLTLTHTHELTSAAFSPDGTKVVTGSKDDTRAIIWDAQTGAMVRDLVGHNDRIHSVAFSPDGTKVVTASFDNTAKIWNVQTGELILTLAGHTYAVYSAAFSPDGTKIVTASNDNTAKIWDAQTGERLLTLVGHTYAVNSAAFSPDGTKIVTASDDNTAKIWDAQTGALLLTLTHTYAVYSAAFSPDDTKILTVSYRFELGRRTLKIWDISGIIIKEYFSNKMLPLQQQALLVTLDTISKQKNGQPITKSDLMENLLFTGIPDNVVKALKQVYKIDRDIFSISRKRKRPRPEY